MKYFYLFSFVVALVFVQRICETQMENKNIKITYEFSISQEEFDKTFKNICLNNPDHTILCDNLWIDLF